MTDKEHGEPGIIVMDLRTLKSEKVYDLYLGNNPNLGPIWDISWSPDGTMLALSDGRNMVSINVNNGKKDNLTYSPANIGDISELHWSPARDYIVYTERKYQDYGMTSDFVLFELQGSNSRKNTFTDGNESHPTWSPTGDEIAFVYEDEILNAVVPNNPEATEKLEQQQYRNIYTMSRDGKEKRKIFEASSRITSLAWSPKGNELVFTSEEKHCGSLYVVTIDGQKLRKLNTLGCSESPSWSPDGRYIIYVGRIGQDSYRWDGKWQIYIMDSLSNEITQLTNDSKWTPFVPVWSR
jgi:TolB protein